MASSSPPLVLARTVQLALLFGSRLFQTVMRTALSPIVGFICEDADLQCGPLSKGHKKHLGDRSEREGWSRLRGSQP